LIVLDGNRAAVRFRTPHARTIWNRVIDRRWKALEENPDGVRVRIVEEKTYWGIHRWAGEHGYAAVSCPRVKEDVLSWGNPDFLLVRGKGMVCIHLFLDPVSEEQLDTIGLLIREGQDAEVGRVEEGGTARMMTSPRIALTFSDPIDYPALSPAHLFGWSQTEPLTLPRAKWRPLAKTLAFIENRRRQVNDLEVAITLRLMEGRSPTDIQKETWADAEQIAAMRSILVQFEPVFGLQQVHSTDPNRIATTQP